MSVVVFYFTDPLSFELEFKAVKFDEWIAAYTYMFMWFCMICGMGVAYLFVHVPTRQQSIESRNLVLSSAFIKLRGLGYLSYFLSVSAYVIYIAISDISVDMIFASLSGEQNANYALRDGLERIPGVTSFMGVAPWWFVYVAYARFVMRRNISVKELLMSAFLLFLVFARGVLDFERRAIVDVLIPAFVVVVFLKTKWPVWMRAVLPFAPIFGVLMLVALFLSTEYFRTWTFYSQYVDVDYVEWALTRLGGYYSTSVNNGITALDAGYSSNGYYLLNGIYRFPVLGVFFGLRQIGSSASNEFTFLLVDRLNPEFNNQGGSIVALFDLGYVGGGIFLFLYGIVAAVVFQKARSGSIFCVLLYTFFFMSFLEITRVWFITSAVPLTSLLFLVVYFIVSKVRRTNSGLPVVKPSRNVMRS